MGASLGPAEDWPILLKLAEMQKQEECTNWSTTENQLVTWTDTLHKQASRGDHLLEDVYAIIDLPFPHEEWATRDLVWQVMDLVPTLMQGISCIRAQSDIVYLHFAPLDPYKLGMLSGKFF
jgi:hypothetical protein